MKKYRHRFLPPLRTAVQALVFILLLFGGQTAIGDQYGRDGSLEIFLQSDKRIYLLGEPIRLTLTLKNHTTETLIVNKRFDPVNDLQWEIFSDPNGLLSLKPAAAQQPTADDYIRLNPNTKIEKRLPELSEIVQDKLKQGLYGIRITYINTEKPKGPETWTGEIITNLVSIQIKSGQRV